MKYKIGEISSLDDLSLHPWDRGVRQKGLMNRQAMGKNLLDFKEILDKHNIPFVIIFGGLLGLVREGNFIEWDKDLDIACFNDTSRCDHWKLKDIKNDLRKKGFCVVSNDQFFLHYDFFIRDGERIEIFWFDRIDSEWILEDRVRYPSHYFDKLEEIEFLGTKFKIPSNTEEFLTLTYGADWRTPNPDAGYWNLNPKEVEKRKK